MATQSGLFRDAQGVLKSEMKQGKRLLPEHIRNASIVPPWIAEFAAESTGRYALATWIIAASPDPSRRPKIVNMDQDSSNYLKLEAQPISIIRSTLRCCGRNSGYSSYEHDPQ